MARRHLHSLCYGGLGLLLAEAAVLWTAYGPPPEALIRQAGTALQLVGVLTVMAGIRDTRKLFSRQADTRSGLFQRLKEFALKLAGRRSVNVIVGAAEISISGMKATAIATHGFNTSLPIAEQVAQLQRAFNDFETAVGQGLTSLEDRAAAETERLVVTEREARAAQARDMDQLFRAAHTGGLDLSMFGAVCLLLGTVLGGMPGEVLSIASWMSGH